MFTIIFWKATLERAIWTFAQTAVALLGADAVGITEVPWVAIASVAATAAVVSILKSIIVAGTTNGSPSITKAEHLDGNARPARN